MTYSSFRVKVPGKLLIAGEYAVLEPKQKAIVTAIDRYIIAEIEPGATNRLSLPQFGLDHITWENKESNVQFNVQDSRLIFIQNSLAVVNRFLQENIMPLKPFHVTIKSELDDPVLGLKYGLGSSAAIVAAVISSILILHSEKNTLPQFDQIFKLSAITHLLTQKNGSGADIAAAVFGGPIVYSAFNQKWLLNELECGRELTELVNMQWPDLSVKPIKVPAGLTVCVGWTKEAAATAPMVREIQKFRKENPQAYTQFLHESTIAVDRLMKSFVRNDCPEAILGLADNRKVLMKLGEKAGVTIETTKLKDLCSVAERYGSGKSSGAGGGDCGIAFLRNADERESLYHAWIKKDIKPLPLNISPIGIEVTEYNCEPSLKEYCKMQHSV